MLDSLPATRIRDESEPLRPELSDAELVDRVSRAGGRVFIGFKPAGASHTRETGVVPAIHRATALAGREAVVALGAVMTQTYRHSSVVAATITPDLAPQLRRMPIVDYIEARFPGYPQTQDTSWGVKRINAHHVWTGGYGWYPARRGEGVNITILDTGLDESHRASGDGPANISVYPDGCAYVVSAGGSTCYDIQTDARYRGHGAHVAGIIASRDNAFGYISIASNAEFESIRVCNSDRLCDPAWVVAALDYVRGMRVARPRQIVNMSLGYCYDNTTLQATVVSTANVGILLIASAGNRVKNATQVEQNCGPYPNQLPDLRNSVMWPARYAEVMAVSGTNIDDSFAAAPGDEGGGGPVPQDSTVYCDPEQPGFCDPDNPIPTSSACPISGSRYGPEVEIAAPFYAISMWADGLYAIKCGTSMSAPVVAAVAALVWSQFPNWTAAQVRQRLRDTAMPLGSPSYFGSGRVDAFHAVYGTPTPPSYPPPPPPSGNVSIAGASSTTLASTCRFEATASGGTAPYAFEWRIDGAVQGDNTNVLYFTNSGVSFVVSVTATDVLGAGWSASLSVSVSAESAQCLDQ